MIIDTHIHIVGSREWWPEWMWDAMNRLQAPRFGKTVEEMDKYRNDSFDPTGDIVVENMDRAGVDKAVVCVADFGLGIPGDDTKLSIEKINRLTYEIVKRHHNRLYFSVGVDPRRRNALEIVEMGVKELGAKTLKLQPGTGFFPNDRMFYPLYEKCVELGLPVNIHTGPVFGPMRSKCTQPIHIDDVAADFPELTIYCTHCGHGSFMEMLAIARVRPNVVCDMGAWLSWLHVGEVLHFYQTWRYLMNMLGRGRLLFASDHTGLKFDPKLKDEYAQWVLAHQKIPDEGKAAGVIFTKEELDSFFSGNAIRLLKLK